MGELDRKGMNPENCRHARSIQHFLCYKYHHHHQQPKIYKNSVPIWLS